MNNHKDHQNKNTQNSQYWFYIENYIHINIKKNSALLYNPYTGKILEYNHPMVLNLLRKLQTPKNMGVTSLSCKDLENSILKNAIEEIQHYFMGDLIDKNFSEGKPVLMTPIVKVEKEVDLLKKDKTRSIGENIRDYLSTVSIYVNSECLHNCNMCKSAYLQTLCCTAETKAKELDWTALRKFLTELSHAPLANIHILGGNLLKYSSLDLLLNQLKTFECRKNFWLNYLHFPTSDESLKFLIMDNCKINIIIGFPLQEDQLRMAFGTVKALKNENITVVPVFLIQNDEQYDKAQALVSELDLTEYEFNPYYDGTNEEFFKANFFLSKEDIEACHPSLNDTFINSTINPVDFGKLIVTPDRKVYANVNEKPIGTLGNTTVSSVYDILMKELRTRKSWRLTRRNVKPCKECTFQDLCPAISNYSRVMNRFNLCHIRQ